MDSLDLKSVSISLKVFLSVYICHLESYEPEYVDILNQLSEISKSQNRINYKLTERKMSLKKRRNLFIIINVLFVKRSVSIICII